jgi:hypothetical protein
MKLALALLLAVVSAAGLNYGFFVQHEATAAGAVLTIKQPLRSARALFTNLRWLAGFVAGFGGWLLYIWALALATLSIVQAASAGGIGILAVLVRRAQKAPLTRREFSGVALSVAGLVLLAASLAGHTETAGRFDARAGTLWLIVLGILAAFAAGPLARFVSAGAGLGIAAGLLYAGGDVASKAALETDSGWVFWPVMTLLHGIGFVAIQIAFQRGGALVTAGIATTLNTSVPIAAGIAVFGDPFPGGLRGVERVTAFACVVAGAALLARPEPPKLPRDPNPSHPSSEARPSS